MVTDTIETFDQTGIVTTSGQHLEADLIVTATGLTLKAFGGIEISVDGDEATGIWSLQDRVVMTEYRMILDGYAFYHDRYRRGADGTWRITHTSYDRIYESMMSMDDVPSYELTANRFA